MLERRSVPESDAPEAQPAPTAKVRRPVHVLLCEDVSELQRAKGKLAPGLRYGMELQALWNPRGDPERFLYQGILVVAIAKVERKVAGWGELFVARPLQGEAENAQAFCRISRLDVAPAFRRRLFVDQKTNLPISQILLTALLEAAPFNAEVVAEVTPDAENLFEQTGFRIGPAGRWIYHR
jgi:hypothetical protein